MIQTPDIISIHSETSVDPAIFGARGLRLSKMATLGLPVPKGVILSASLMANIARGAAIPDLPEGLSGCLVSLRSSALNADWGGATAIMNIGICDAMMPDLINTVGKTGAHTLYRRFIHSFATNIDELDAEDFEFSAPDGPERVAKCKSMYLDETGMPFPQNPQEQLHKSIRHMAKAWDRPTARMLREATGAPQDAGMALVIQCMALGIGNGIYGSGVAQNIDEMTGAPMLWGQYLPQGQGQDGVINGHNTQAITAEDGLEAQAPEVTSKLKDYATIAAKGLRDACQFEFTVENGQLWLLDMQPAKRSPLAAVRIAVDLAEAGIITRSDALLRIDPHNLVYHLHPRIKIGVPRDVIATGLSASPGAASGRIVFTTQAAMTHKAQDLACILVRVETSPEDIRGIHAAVGVLTLRGGMTSHAAVIARGLGVPCVVGANDLKLDQNGQGLRLANGDVLLEGDVISLDGTLGQALRGEVAMTQPSLDGSFKILMDWADDARTIGVRANADTPEDARVARRFHVDGIGLCRTEHMFFDDGRLNVMREMILASKDDERNAALAKLLPMQRADFIELFEIMRSLPVTIRLLDPPLHEFLPRGAADIVDLATEMGLDPGQLAQRVADMAEVNPMLGMRGVRVGITHPEIYDMQARAIFEAAAQVNQSGSAKIAPEIMIPLVSANREVELVKARIEAVAKQVEQEQGVTLNYRLGAMVETPRAALRAGDLAQSCSFLSFGTNDLTQMAYGLSRDDAGRFMREYVEQGVFTEDPFHTLDVEGVGELLLIAAKRALAVDPEMTLGICGEHGGDPASVRFCKLAGFSYVSCSPYRVPIARLAAAQASIMDHESKGDST